MLIVLHGWLLGVWLLITMLPGTASGHDAQAWFNPIPWGQLDINYKLDESIPGAPTSSFANRINNAADDWSAVSGVALHYDNLGGANRPWGHPCQWQTDTTDLWFFYRPVGGTHAILCTVTGQGIVSARIAFESTESWYNGTGNVPAGEISVLETALHELGHTTGTFVGGSSAFGNSEGHWPYGAPGGQCTVGGAASDWTMCPVGWLGESWLYPLTTHDIDTFQDHY